MTLDELSQLLIDELQKGEDARWAAGDLLASLPPWRKGRRKGEDLSLRALASAVGRSDTYLRSLRLVSSTFAPESRAQDLHWYTHLFAARSRDPEGWLEKAVAGGWSPRQLREALIAAGEISVVAKERCPTCGR